MAGWLRVGRGHVFKKSRFLFPSRASHQTSSRRYTDSKAIIHCDILSAIDRVPEFARKKFGRCPISAAERDFAYGSALLPSFINSLHQYEFAKSTATGANIVLTLVSHVYVFDVDGG